MIELDVGALASAFGFGVAGNFTGHLEQAGEAGDFAAVEAPPGAPRGIFPWYVPGADTQLGVFPLSSSELVRPAGDGVDLQLEPEAGLICDVAYEDGRVTALIPRAIAAFDDASIRREGAPKISAKKNWGAGSKGLAARAFEVTDLSADGPTATLRLACFLRRDRQTHAYGADSPLPGYSYYGQTLLTWMTERLRSQSDAGPLEDVGALLAAAGSPATAVVGIGATRYTDFGASTYLEAGDETIIAVYDSATTTPDALATAVAEGRESSVPDASVLVRGVSAGG